MKQIPKCFATTPIVYAVGENYQIIVPVLMETLMWAEIGENRFYDDVNGIMRSNCTTHRMTVPMELLDRVGEYKICYRIVKERKPYFSDVSDVFEYVSRFRAVGNDNLRFFHISDAHNKVDEPVAAAKAFGKIDFLILNGDIPDHSGDIKNFTAIHNIASEITNGEIPVVFSRGNHDMRGIYAENIAEHTPTDNGKSYYTFLLGSVWGMVLDCGEDKADDNAEYGYTICCEDFRQRQTFFIKEVIARAEHEYEAGGVTNRIVVCHAPFSEKNNPPFDIEEETYAEWCRLLKEHIKPDVMICGHVHQAYITKIGDDLDAFGQPCPVIVASAAGSSNATIEGRFGIVGTFMGAGIAVNKDGYEVIYVGDNVEKYHRAFLDIKK